MKTILLIFLAMIVSVQSKAFDAVSGSAINAYANTLVMPGGIGTPLNPTNQTGMFLWYVSTEEVFANTTGTTPATQDSLVKRWNNISISSYDLTSIDTAGFSPSFNTNVLNGYPVISFNGVRNFLGSGTFNRDTPIAIFVVVRFRTNSDSIILGNSSISYVGCLGTTASGNATVWHGDPPLSMVSGPSIVTNQFYVMTEVADGTNSYVMVNGTKSANFDPGSYTMPSLILGDFFNPVTYEFPFIGDIAEIIGYTAAPTEEDVEGIQNYLRLKYGL